MGMPQHTQRQAKQLASRAEGAQQGRVARLAASGSSRESMLSPAAAAAAIATIATAAGAAALARAVRAWGDRRREEGQVRDDGDSPAGDIQAARWHEAADAAQPSRKPHLRQAPTALDAAAPCTKQSLTALEAAVAGGKVVEVAGGAVPVAGAPGLVGAPGRRAVVGCGLLVPPGRVVVPPLPAQQGVVLWPGGGVCLVPCLTHGGQPSSTAWWAANQYSVAQSLLRCLLERTAADTFTTAPS